MCTAGKLSGAGGVTVLPQNGYLTTLMTTIRDINTDSTLFVATVQKVATQLMVGGMSIGCRPGTAEADPFSPISARSNPGGASESHNANGSMLRRRTAHDGGVRCKHPSSWC